MRNCREMHLNGFYVQFSADDGSEIGAIGRDCGFKYFGTKWTLLKTEFRKRQNEQDRQDRVRQFLPEAGDVLAVLEALMPKLQAQKETRELLETRAREFFSFCVDAAKRGDGWIGRDVKESFVRVARIEGQQFFLERAPTTEARILRDDIERVLKLVEHGKHNHEQLASRVSEIGNTRKRLDGIRAWMSSARIALSPDNLTRITGAYSEVVGGKAPRVSKSQKWFIVQDCLEGTKLFELDRAGNVSISAVAA